MSNLVLVFGFIFFLAHPLVVSAEGEHSERLAVAKEYVSAYLQDMDLTRVVEQMWIPLAQQIEASKGSALNSSQLEKIDKLYQDTFYDKMYNLMLQQDEIMADIYSLAEITALRDFYYTEEGRSVMIKMPDIIAAQQPVIMKMVQETIPTIMPEIQKIMEGGQYC